MAESLEVSGSTKDFNEDISASELTEDKTLPVNSKKTKKFKKFKIFKFLHKKKPKPANLEETVDNNIDKLEENAGTEFKSHKNDVKSINENIFYELDTQDTKQSVEFLKNQVKDLQIQVEESRLNASVLRRNVHEFELAKSQVEALTDETERLNLQISFLEEEKLEFEDKVDELQEYIKVLKMKNNQLEKKRNFYKKKFLQSNEKGYEITADMISQIQKLLAENRFMLMKTFHERVKSGDGLSKFFRINADYMALDIEKNELKKKLAHAHAKLTKKILIIADMKEDLQNALTELERAGVECSNVNTSGVAESSVSTGSAEKVCNENVDYSCGDSNKKQQERNK